MYISRCKKEFTNKWNCSELNVFFNFQKKKTKKNSRREASSTINNAEKNENRIIKKNC